jgi:hypothetical protein
MGQAIVRFIGTVARESTMDKMSAEEKKNSRVSPCFLHLKILKSLLGRHEAVVESALASSSTLSSSSSS